MRSASLRSLSSFWIRLLAPLVVASLQVTLS
nr:MAG TPA: hypothetical protein [Caudoviricetes sp.]